MKGSDHIDVRPGKLDFGSGDERWLLDVRFAVSKGKRCHLVVSKKKKGAETGSRIAEKRRNQGIKKVRNRGHILSA